MIPCLVVEGVGTAGVRDIVIDQEVIVALDALKRDEHPLQRLGRYRLPLDGQRVLSRRPRQAQPDPLILTRWIGSPLCSGMRRRFLT